MNCSTTNHTVFQLFRNYRSLCVVRFNKYIITYKGFYTTRNISITKCLDYVRYKKIYRLIYGI